MNQPLSYFRQGERGHAVGCYGLERGTPAAITPPMLRWLQVLLLLVVSTTAAAQPASEPAPRASEQLAATTSRAAEAATAAQRRTAELSARRNALRQRLDEELAAVDRLKRGPRGWRTKSQLEDRLAEANETQKQLELADAQLAGANAQLASQRARLVAAIDAELAAGAPEPRARGLRGLRDAVTPRRAARRIVLPDTKIDPGLPSEELEEQAAAIRDSETELERQIKGLEEQANELQRSHDLRQQHARTLELDQRDDNTSRRTGRTSTGDRTSVESAAPPASPSSGDPGSGGSGGGTFGGAGMFETDAHIVLPEVVDPSILDGVQSAYRSGDLRQRAEAVRRARDAVVARQRFLRQQRARIEGLSKQRR